MGVNVQLSKQQINQIASSISLKEISDYVKAHQKEYEEFLKKEEKQKKKTEEQNFSSDNSVWKFYTDETICKVNINSNMKGSEQQNEKSICQNTRKIEIRQEEIHF